MNAVQADRVRLGIDGEYLQGLTSISLSSNVPYYGGTLINVGIPKAGLTGESLFSMSIGKFLTPEDITNKLRRLVLGLSRKPVEIVTDSFGSRATGVSMQGCWFDEFVLNFSSSQLATCSWECKSKVLTNFTDVEREPFVPAGDSFMDNTFFEFTSSEPALEEVENITMSISTSKTLISTMWGNDYTWAATPLVSISLSSVDTDRVDALTDMDFDSVDFGLSIYSDAAKTNKIAEFDLKNCRLDSLSDGFSESSEQAVSYSFSKNLAPSEATF